MRIPLELVDWEAVAKACDYSVTAAAEFTGWEVWQIERHFWRKWKCTPKARFKEFRAAELQRDVREKGASAAAEARKMNLSNFGRMYKATFGYSPRQERPGAES